jgi:HNH endonuclease
MHPHLSAHYARLAIPCEWCSTHFLVWPNGSTRRFCSWACFQESLAPTPTGIALNFWPKVKVGHPDECWPWTASTNGVYGAACIGHQVNRGAHRVAFWLVHGRWPKVCRHTCDVPLCCNPRHLCDGTSSDNIKDMMERGRHRTQYDPVERARVAAHIQSVRPLDQQGERHPNAKLTDAQVLEIRARAENGEPQVGLAAEYGVNWRTISIIVKRKAWGHLR